MIVMFEKQITIFVATVLTFGVFAPPGSCAATGATGRLEPNAGNATAAAIWWPTARYYHPALARSANRCDLLCLSTGQCTAHTAAGQRFRTIRLSQYRLHQLHCPSTGSTGAATTSLIMGSGINSDMQPLPQGQHGCFLDALALGRMCMNGGGDIL